MALSPNQFGPNDATREVMGEHGDFMKRNGGAFGGGTSGQTMSDMRSDASKRNGQEQLFDPSGLKEAPAHLQSKREYEADHRTWFRGQLGDPNLTAGTARSGGTHFGTDVAAVDRLSQMPDLNSVHEHRNESDKRGNAYVMGLRIEADSPKLGSDRWVRKTDQGDNWPKKDKPVFYKNKVEDPGSVSGYAPRELLSTWREHVLANPTEAHPTDVWHAQQVPDGLSHEPGKGYDEYKKSEVLHPRLFGSKKAFGEHHSDSYSDKNIALKGQDKHMNDPYSPRLPAQDVIKPRHFKPRGYLEDI